jgi:uncharacterized protein
MVVATEIDSVIQAMVDTLVAAYQPQRVILFGSYAYGEPHPDSDIDLLIIKDTPDAYYDRCVAVRLLLWDFTSQIPTDIIVLTPTELAKRLEIGDHFIEDITQDGIVLYPPSNLTYAASPTSPRFVREETPEYSVSRPTDSLIPEDWLRIAEKDLVRVELMLTFHDPEDAGFHLQQAIEKLLKAFLLSHGWRLKRIHNLDPLLRAAAAYEPSLLQYRVVCVQITEFYNGDRYPFGSSTPITQERVQEALADAQPLITTLRLALTKE